MNTSDIDLGTELRKYGYRLTTQRQLVLESLQQVDGHATADEVYDRVHTVSTAINRATVYRTLHFLCSIGIVTSTSLVGGRLAYELTPTEPHHHLICGACGSDEVMSHNLVTPFLESITTAYGFDVVDTLHLTLFGECSRCRAKQPASHKN